MIRKKGLVTAFCLGIVFAGAILHTGGLLKGNKVVFPGLPEIGEAFLRLICDSSTWQKIGVTLLHVAEALAISAVLGIIIGLAEGISEWIYSFFRPLMILIRSIPMIVLVIVIMSLISYRAVPVTAASVILLPLFSEAVYEGCRSLDQELIDVYRMNGGLSMTVKVAVSAEYLVQIQNSLGKAIYSSGYFSEYAEIYAYALIMILLVLMITSIPELILRHGVFRWKKQGGIWTDHTKNYRK